MTSKESQIREVSEIIWREDLYPRFETIPEPLIPEIGFIQIGNRLHISLDFATNGNCPESLRNLYAGYIEKGIIHLIGSVTKYYYSIYRDYLKNRKGGDESQIRNRLGSKLELQGWIIEKESQTPWGRIDILAIKATDKKIIEIKINNDSNTMAHALGQLLFHSRFHSNASLWIYTPEKPDLMILSILNSFNVNYLEIENE